MIYKKLETSFLGFSVEFLTGIIVSSVFFLSQFELAESHVSLTFPPSRTFQLDFLNSFWTKPPCGMPKGKFRTSLIAGQPLNITWHLGYAHNGGFHLELLNENEEKLMDLTDDFVLGSNTAQAHQVTIPGNITCKGCTIRLLRQVPEFSPDFFFWSCADVDIVALKNYRETCSGKGTLANGRCNCYKDYWGHRCQYKDECETDSECNVGGKCIYLDGSALPTKQCFCAPNYFGEKCSRVNPASIARTPKQLDLANHVKVPLSDRMTMYFRTKVGLVEDQDEIEFVLVANASSFLGLGWRPSSLGPACKSWPFDANSNRLDAPPLYRPKRQAIPPVLPVVPVAGGTPLQVQVLPQVPVLSHQPPPQEPDYAIAPPPSAPEQPPQPDFAEEPYVILHEWAAHDPFTPMDCTDIVIGTAREGRARVRDYYSRGRHTPQPDSMWGGKDDIVGATGWELNGQTTIVFRRKVRSDDGPDHTIKDEMLMIWSRGQQPGEHEPNPHFQLDKGKSRISDFYTVDELKYHGLGPQRGVLYINFTAARSEFIK